MASSRRTTSTKLRGVPRCRAASNLARVANVDAIVSPVT
jgi:hypothetical protein